jgi:hypothetical protein
MVLAPDKEGAYALLMLIRATGKESVWSTPVRQFFSENNFRIPGYEESTRKRISEHHLNTSSVPGTGERLEPSPRIPDREVLSPEAHLRLRKIITENLALSE